MEKSHLCLLHLKPNQNAFDSASYQGNYYIKKPRIRIADPLHGWGEKYTWKSFLSHMFNLTIGFLFLSNQ